MSELHARTGLSGGDGLRLVSRPSHPGLNPQEIEEELRSQLYAALFKLTFARATEKPAMVASMRFMCRLLHQVAITGAAHGRDD